MFFLQLRPCFILIDYKIKENIQINCFFHCNIWFSFFSNMCESQSQFIIEF